MYWRVDVRFTNCGSSIDDSERRDFIVLTASASAAVGAACVAWPFVDSLNPAANVLALSSIEVNLSHVIPGQVLRVKWRGKPVFIRHRTEEEIKKARADDVSKLPDYQKDSDRVLEGKEQWLIVVGVCTHLGCIPLDNQGEFGGWFCPCHGSHYDLSGRIRKGPAPTNLEVPEYAFTDDKTIIIG